jgi:hypothetical protein
MKEESLNILFERIIFIQIGTAKNKKKNIFIHTKPYQGYKE